MFRTVGDQASLWESVLPPELLRLPDELARVDALLDDPVFFAPFVPFFDPRIGRPSTPMETYLRLMFLKFRYRLGYETLCREVSRLDHLAAVLPDPAGRGGAASDDVDEADHPVRVGGGGRVERGAAGQGRRGEGAAHQPGAGRHHGGARRTWPTRPTPGCWPRRSAGSRRPGGGSRPPVARSAPRCGTGPGRPGKRAHGIGAKLRSRAPPAGTRRRPRCAGSPVSWPIWPRPPSGTRERLLVNARRALRRARAKAAELRRRRGARCGRGAASGPAGPRGQRPDRPARRHPADRRADPAADGRGRPRTGRPGGSACTTRDARPIAKGRLGKPVEFGHKAQVVDNDDGVVLDHTSSRATRPTHPSWRPRSSGSRTGPAARRAP